MLMYLALPALMLATSFAVARRAQTNTTRGWIVLVGLWLCVPAGYLVYVYSGSGIRYLLGCSISAAAPLNCTMFGVNLHHVLDPLLISGVVFALFVRPWFAIGSVLIMFAAVAQVASRNKS